MTSGGLDAADTRIAKGGELHAAFELLAEVGLVVKSDDGTTWRAVDPAAVQARVVAPLGQQGAELIAESAHWAQSFNALSQTWRRSPSAVGAPFAEIRGLADHQQLPRSPGRRRRATSCSPPSRSTGAGSSGSARRAPTRSRPSSGACRVRTLYQHAARRGADTRRYVAAVTAAGAEVRTLDEFFNRLLVFDRRVAVIPSHEGTDVGDGDQRQVDRGYLVDMFERHWERARPFTSSETSLMRDIAAEQRAMTIRMLLEGRADPAGAKRLGVSPRTYAAYVADLKSEFEVETRFQLGYEMGKRGISGRETDESSA